MRLIPTPSLLGRIASRVVALACILFVGGSPARIFAAEVATFQPPETFQMLCYECHGDGSHKGSFALDELIAQDADPAHRGMWKKVWTNIRHEFMPPATGEYMSSDERREVARWIERQVFGVDPEQVDPGVVTIRRLNREEYQNTIEDLFGAGLELRDQMLPDDTAFGFDNIGDAQTLSPVQFNRYVDLAEYIVDQVILVDGRTLPRFEFSNNTAEAVESVVEQSFKIDLEHDGEYEVDLVMGLGGWHDFGGDVQVSVTVGDQVVGEIEIPLGGDVEYDYQWTFDAPRGSHDVVFTANLIKVVAPVEPVEVVSQVEADLAEIAQLTPEERARRERRRRPRPAELKFRRLELAVTGPLNAGVLADYPEPHKKIFFRGDAPDDEAGRRQYASAILRRVADRAYHRPVDEPTLVRLTNLATTDDNFERGIASSITAILASPRFLFREEVQPQPNNPQAQHFIDDFALASRLSYLLWVSIPDAELNALAAAGRLREELDTQVARMLADPKSQRFFQDFTGQWLRTRNVLMTSIAREGDLASVREDMKNETDSFFEYIARNDRDLIELITARYTFLNEKLATFYGVPDVTGEEMRRVDLPADSPRGGVLTQGSFLVSTSNPDRTSPVKRGVFVLDNLLGSPPPPPPAAVPALEEAKQDGVELKTLRKQLAAHRADPACAACHAHFDPIGLALENFSHIGQWRDTEEEQPIDASGEMVTGETFDDLAGLRDIIATRKDKFYRSVTEKLMTYALGRGLEPYDAVTVDAIVDKLMNEGGKFSTLLGALIDSPAFQMRRGDGSYNAIAMSAP